MGQGLEPKVLPDGKGAVVQDPVQQSQESSCAPSVIAKPGEGQATPDPGAGCEGAINLRKPPLAQEATLQSGPGNADGRMAGGPGLPKHEIRDYGEYQRNISADPGKKREVMDLLRQVEGNLKFPNATRDVPYDESINLIASMKVLKAKHGFYFGGNTQDLNDNGLALGLDKDCSTLRLSGVPKESRDVALTLRFAFDDPKGGRIRYRGEFPIGLFVNANPRDLWLERPATDPDYKTPDTQHESIPINGAGSGPKGVYGASRRGRYHAHNGTYRDDCFAIRHEQDHDWYLLAVADGAGSARYSREGARLACEFTMMHAREVLEKHGDRLNQRLLELGEQDPEAGQILEDLLRNGALFAHDNIESKAARFARSKGDPTIGIKDYSTTLLLAALHRISGEHWVIATFWIGDGAMAILGNSGRAMLCGTPDEGEFSGQTKFLTMGALVFQNRQISIFPAPNGFRAFYAMTDGVSDPRFETDNNLRDPGMWQAFDNEVCAVLGGEAGPDPAVLCKERPEERLLEWLNFWSPGNHDDRTLVVVR